MVGTFGGKKLIINSKLLPLKLVSKLEQHRLRWLQKSPQERRCHFTGENRSREQNSFCFFFVILVPVQRLFVPSQEGEGGEGGGADLGPYSPLTRPLAVGNV